ncbi:hypothetical protein ACFSMX_01875 [Flectobacillus roseus]|uniref:hypothetical protein n=1 Tax=Flectobacillus roseus TaxID=502259 RepID=UPI003627C38F
MVFYPVENDKWCRKFFNTVKVIRFAFFKYMIQKSIAFTKRFFEVYVWTKTKRNTSFECTSRCLCNKSVNEYCAIRISHKNRFLIRSKMVLTLKHHT